MPSAEDVTRAARPPSVDVLARSLAADHDFSELPHPLRVDAARRAVAEAMHAADPDSATERAVRHARAIEQGLLQTVVNATGVLLHTNLGRAPVLPWRDAGSGLAPVRYGNVELDLATGRRGSRHNHAAELMARLCGADAGLVVNNCAAAVMLVLAAHARGKAVIVSRGELVEIGGGFRVPEVLEQSGARLIEVGTTNRTRLGDYRAAIDSCWSDGLEVGLILKVHQSNYRITGFTEEVDVTSLASLGVPVVADIGSGLLDATLPWLADQFGHRPTLPWLAGEPAARQTLAAGAALVTFSGDKLLGGPQAGVIAGTADMVAACRRHPLSRALRPGALVLEALQSVAFSYLRGEGTSIPFWRMATRPIEELYTRAKRVAEAIGNHAVVIDTEAVAGGGTLPGQTIASVGVSVKGDVTLALRRATPPVVARVVDGNTVCDMRTIDPSDDTHVAEALSAATRAASLSGHADHR